jgi:pSer/pThr/pTyr-binding forkhead associated (FHA) protein
VARHFPVRVGRIVESSLCLDEPGVWDRHFELALEFPGGVRLKSNSEAITWVNGERVGDALLRAGDLIEIGSVQMRFWLSPTRQRSLRVRETATWLMFGLLSLGQIGLIYWLLLG